MSTKTLSSTALRFSKTIIAISVLALGFGMQSASAALLTKEQAKALAGLLSSAKVSNAAVTAVRDTTAGSGAGFAAANARLIGSYIDGDNIAALATLANGLSFNYPNQQAAIVTQIILLNDKTRDNAAKIIATLGSSLSADAATQLAVTLNSRLLSDTDTRKNAGVIAYALFTSINNSSVGTDAERANQLAIAAGNLASRLLSVNKHGTVTKSNLKAFTQIVYVFGRFVDSIDTGSLNREEIVNNMVGYFAATIKSSTGSLTSDQLNLTQSLLLATLPKYSDVIKKVIQDVINNNGNFGPITPSETPH